MLGKRLDEAAEDGPKVEEPEDILRRERAKEKNAKNKTIVTIWDIFRS